MRTLWDDSPLDLKDIVAGVREKHPEVRWDYKTYHSFLRILEEKGLVGAERSGKNKRYSPLISEEQALGFETDSLVSRRPYYGSVSSLMVSMADQGKLTAAEKDELVALAERLSRESGGQ